MIVKLGIIKHLKEYQSSRSYIIYLLQSVNSFSFIGSNSPNFKSRSLREHLINLENVFNTLIIDSNGFIKEKELSKTALNKTITADDLYGRKLSFKEKLKIKFFNFLSKIGISL